VTFYPQDAPVQGIKVKLGDRVVAASPTRTARGIVDEIHFVKSALTGEPMPPYVWIRVEKGGREVFSMADVEKEQR
jgi:hypothetical protein